MTFQIKQRFPGFRRSSPRRPALISGLAFAAGVAAAGAYSVELVLIPLAAVAAGWSFRWFRRHALCRVITIILVIFLLGALRHGTVSMLWPIHHISEQNVSRGKVTVFGQVAAEPDVRPRLTFITMALDSVASGSTMSPRSGRVLMRFRFDPGILLGTQVSCEGRLGVPRVPKNPSDFDYADYLARRDIYAVFTPTGTPVKIDSNRQPMWGWTSSIVSPLRSAIYKRLSRHLAGEPEGLVRGILFGEKSAMRESTVRAFEETGTLHLLAVSGSNVAVVILVVFGAATFFRLPMRARIGISLFGVVLFSYLAHNEASVVRASVAGVLVLCGQGLKRPAEPFNVLGATLLILLMYEPRQLFDVGFQLSFAATAGILVFAGFSGKPRRSHGVFSKSWRALGLALGVSTSAQLAVMPILAASFNQIPLVTLLSNLVCVPLAGLTTAAGLVTLLVAPLGGWILSALSAATWICASLLLFSVEWFHNLNVPVWALATPGSISWVIYYACLCAAIAFIKIPHVRRLLLFGVMAALSVGLFAGSCKAPEPLRVLVLAAGPQDISLVRWPSGSVWQIASRESVQDRRTTELVRANLLRLGWDTPDTTWLIDTLHRPAMQLAESLPHHSLVQGPIPADITDQNLNATARHDVVAHAVASRIVALTIRAGNASVAWVARPSTWSAIASDQDSDRFVITPRVKFASPQDGWNGRTRWIEAVSTGRRSTKTARLGDDQILRTSRHGAVSIVLRPNKTETETSFR